MGFNLYSIESMSSVLFRAGEKPGVANTRSVFANAFSIKEAHGVDAFEDWINKSVLNVFDEEENLTRPFGAHLGASDSKQPWTLSGKNSPLMIDKSQSLT